MLENEIRAVPEGAPSKKVAVVGVVGRTNAGKSTLVNRLVGEKVSIVSPVEQTTRNTIRGIVADPRGQLVLLDTPGLHKAVGHLGTLLNRMARRSSAGVDVLCVVFDASQEPQLEDEGWMRRVAKDRLVQVRRRRNSPLSCGSTVSVTRSFSPSYTPGATVLSSLSLPCSMTAGGSSCISAPFSVSDSKKLPFCTTISYFFHSLANAYVIHIHLVTEIKKKC